MPLTNGAPAGESPLPCQLHGLQQMEQPLGRIEIAWQFRNRLRRFAKRRLRYLRNWLRERGSRPAAAVPATTVPATAQSLDAPLQPGDLVRVKSRAEIQATLDRWDALKGCSVMEEMWPYCGTTQRVLKRVEKFLDERDYRVHRCKRTVILAGVNCSGTVDFGPCDRSCYFFWREEWLEKIA